MFILMGVGIKMNEFANAMNQIQKYEINKDTHLLKIMLVEKKIQSIIADLKNILTWRDSGFLTEGITTTALENTYK